MATLTERRGRELYEAESDPTWRKWEQLAAPEKATWVDVAKDQLKGGLPSEWPEPQVSPGSGHTGAGGSQAEPEAVQTDPPPYPEGDPPTPHPEGDGT